MLRRWLQARRRRRQALENAAAEYRARHGAYARGLAGQRSLDAYLLGDFDEQERWGRIREEIHEKDRGTAENRLIESPSPDNRGR
jgi:hypothetical protein